MRENAVAEVFRVNFTQENVAVVCLHLNHYIFETKTLKGETRLSINVLELLGFDVKIVE